MLLEDQRQQRINDMANLHLQLLNIGAGPTKDGRAYMTKVYQDQIALLTNGPVEPHPTAQVQDMLSKIRNDPFIGPILNRVENRQRKADLERRQAALAAQGVSPPTSDDMLRMRRIVTSGRRRQ